MVALTTSDARNLRDAELDASEVREWVNELESDDHHTKLRDVQEKRWIDLVAMQDRPDLSEQLKRSGIVVAMNSPMLGDLADQLISDIRPFTTNIGCIPMDRENDIQRLCDEREKYLAVWKQQANPEWKVSADQLWHLFLSSYCVTGMRVRPDATTPPGADEPVWVDFPWSIEVWEPNTCFFSIEATPFIPKVLGRKYEASVRTLEQTFAGAGGMYQDSIPIWKDGKWNVEILGEDYQVGKSNKYKGNAKRGEFCEVYELYTETHTYIYLHNKTGGKGDNKANANTRTDNSGILVWSGPNPTGCVPAVVSSGRRTPVRAIPNERLQPAFRAGYQIIKNENRAWATIATMAENAKAELVNQKGAETLKAESKLSKTHTGSYETDADGPAIIDLHGDRLMLWEQQEMVYALKQAEHWAQQRQEFVNSWRQLSDPEVIKDARVNVFLTYAESTKRRLSGVLSAYDSTWKLLMWMAERTCEYFDRPFELYSSEELTFGAKKKVTAGELVTLDPSKKFKHELVVATQSMTEAEQRMRREDMNARRAAGTATFVEALSIDYTDIDQQLEDLAIDRMLEHTMITFGDDEVDLAVQDAMKLLNGVYIGFGQPVGVAPGPAALPAPGGGAAPMRAPAIAGPGGGSSG